MPVMLLEARFGRRNVEVGGVRTAVHRGSSSALRRECYGHRISGLGSCDLGCPDSSTKFVFQRVTWRARSSDGGGSEMVYSIRSPFLLPSLDAREIRPLGRGGIVPLGYLLFD